LCGSLPLILAAPTTIPTTAAISYAMGHPIDAIYDSQHHVSMATATDGSTHCEDSSEYMLVAATVPVGMPEAVECMLGDSYEDMEWVCR
jgi:hypothetical protein